MEMNPITERLEKEKERERERERSEKVEAGEEGQRREEQA